MSVLSKAALITLYNDLTIGQFKDAQVIPISRLREFVQDITDSAIFDENVGDGPWKQDRVRLKTVATLPSFVYTTPSGIPTITASANGALSIDGIAVAVGDSILVSEQSTSFHNGVYVVTSKGSSLTKYALQLRIDSRSSNQIAYAIYEVLEGSTNEDTLWKQIFNETGAAIANVAFEEFAPGAALDIELDTTIGTASVLTGNSVPIDLLPAPGSNSAIIPERVWFIIPFNTIPYDTNIAVELYVGSTPLTGGLLVDFLAASTKRIIPVDIQPFEAEFDAPLTFKVLDGDPLNGNSSVRLIVKYRTLTI